MSSANPETKPPNQYVIIERYNVFEKFFYGLMSIFCWFYGYLTLIPYFLKHGTFTNIHLSDVPSFCVDDQGKLEKTYRNQKSIEILSSGFPGVSILSDLIKRASKLYGNKEYFGKRKVIEKINFTDKVTGRTIKKYRLGEYEWKTFNEIAGAVHHFQHGLLKIDSIRNQLPNNPQKIAIFAKNSEEWIVSKLGVFASSSILVTVFFNMDDSSIVHALTQTQPPVIVVDKSCFKRIVKLLDKLGEIKDLIVIGKNVDKTNTQLAAKRVAIWTYDEIIELGKNDESPTVVSVNQPNPDDLALIMYTSGSSGRPKGVCLSHQNMLSSLGCMPVKQLEGLLDRTPFYLPCAHTLGSGYVILSLMLGFKIGHCRTLTLFDSSPGLMEGTKGDFSELKPTGSFVVPLIVDRLVKAVIAKIKTKKRFIQFLFDFALRYKVYFLKMGHNSSPIIDKYTPIWKVRGALGGHLKLVFSAGGPISNDISFAFSSLFSVNLKQIYGTTETFGGGTFSDIRGPYSLDCGAVSPSVEIKLIPWEEGIRFVDKTFPDFPPQGKYFPNDIPNPRGEVCIYGDCVAKCYFLMEEETKVKFVIDEKTKKKWYLTGDIGEYMPNGNFKIIDRKENIIKLSGGEFISLSCVESCIYNSDYVEMCCCVPSSNFDSLVAIITTKRPKILELVLSQNKLDHVEDLDPFINDPEIQKVVIHDIKSKLTELTKFEKPSRFIITADVWSPENELLTSILKIRRTKIKKHYEQFI